MGVIIERFILVKYNIFVMFKEIDFQEVGLSRNEGKIYEVLVRFGKSGAARLSKESGVPYGKIYTVLAKLEEKELVAVIPGKVKMFRATDPKNILKVIENKKKKIEEVKKKISELKKYYEVGEKEPVVTATGIKSFYFIDRISKDAEKTAYNIKLNVEVRPEWVRLRKLATKKGVKFYDLVRFDEETKERVHRYLKFSKDIRKIENEGLAMSIIDTDEVMIGLVKSSTTVLIRDKAFAKIMKKLYMAYYDQAEKI